MTRLLPVTYILFSFSCWSVQGFLQVRSPNVLHSSTPLCRLRSSPNDNEENASSNTNQEQEQKPQERSFVQWLERLKPQNPTGDSKFQVIIDDSQLLYGDILIIFALMFSKALVWTATSSDFPGWDAPIPLLPPHLASTLTHASALSGCWVSGALLNYCYTEGAVWGTDRGIASTVAAWFSASNLYLIGHLLLLVILHQPLNSGVSSIVDDLSGTAAVMLLWRGWYSSNRTGF